MAEPSSAAGPLIVNKIVLFGDDQFEQSSHESIGLNLAPALSREYYAKLQIITHGYAGYTSEHARWIIDPILDAEMPAPNENRKRGTVKLVVLAFGTNDAATPEGSSHSVDIDLYMENMEFIVSRIQERGAKVVLVCPAPVNELAADASVHRDTLKARAYGEALEKLAQSAQIPYINLWTEFATSTGWKEGQPIPCQRPKRGRRSSSLDPDRKNVARGIMSGARHNRNMTRDEHFAALFANDGVHISRRGYQLWNRCLVELIRKQWPELDSKNIKPVFPHIDDIDNDDLPNSLWKNIKN